MKGKQEIIDKLNGMLSEELNVINQYMDHAEICNNWGYDDLHHAIEKLAIDVMKHADKLITLILFLDGKPIVSSLNKISIVATDDNQHKKDHAAESDAIASFNKRIRLAVELGDNGTKEMLETILKDEEAHISLFEEQLKQIKQMGMQKDLGNQSWLRKID